MELLEPIIVLRRQTLYPTELRALRKSDSKTFMACTDTVLGVVSTAARATAFSKRSRSVALSCQAGICIHALIRKNWKAGRPSIAPVGDGFANYG
jgi:hypothetical protein